MKMRRKLQKDFLEIQRFCKEKNITLLCTPWDIPSVDFLEKLNIPGYKIASADLTNLPLISYISNFKKPATFNVCLLTNLVVIRPCRLDCFKNLIKHAACLLEIFPE